MSRGLNYGTDGYIIIRSPSCFQPAVHNRFFSRTALSPGRFCTVSKTRKNCCAHTVCNISWLLQVRTDYLHGAVPSVPLDVSTSKSYFGISQDRPNSSLSRGIQPAALLYTKYLIQYGGRELNPYPDTQNDLPHHPLHHIHHHVAHQLRELGRVLWRVSYSSRFLQPILGVWVQCTDIDGLKTAQLLISNPKGILVTFLPRTFTSPIKLGILARKVTILWVCAVESPVKNILHLRCEKDFNVFACPPDDALTNSFMPLLLQSAGMANCLAIICLAAMFTSNYGLQEQVKLESELNEAHTCEVGNLATDWGTASKYLAVTPTNRSVSERDVFSMGREFICAASRVISRTEKTLREEAELTKAALDHTISIIHGILATCSTLVGFLTLACCMARRGPFLLNLAGLPSAAQSQMLPPALPFPLQLAAEQQPGHLGLVNSPAQSAAQPNRDPQLAVACLAARYRALVPSHSQPRGDEELNLMERGTLQREAREWFSCHRPYHYQPPTSDLSIPNHNHASNPHPVTLQEDGAVANASLARESIQTASQVAVNTFRCTNKYSWHCISPWVTDQHTYIACGKHDKAKEWEQIVGPFQSVLAATGAGADLSCPTYQAYKVAVGYIVDQEKRFQLRWTKQHNLQHGKRLSTTPEEEAAAPAKRHCRPGRAQPCNPAPADQASPVRPPSTEILAPEPVRRNSGSPDSNVAIGDFSDRDMDCGDGYNDPPHTFRSLTPPYWTFKGTKFEYVEYADPPSVKEEPGLTNRSNTSSPVAVIPDLTDSEMSDEDELAMVPRPGSLLQSAVPSQFKFETIQVEPPTAPAGPAGASYAASDYGPDSVEENRPNIDAINRANQMKKKL